MVLSGEQEKWFDYLLLGWDRKSLVKPIGDPQEGFFYPTFTLMMDSYIQSLHGNIVKMIMSGKSGSEFKNFPRKLIVNMLLKSIISINCKQFMVRNITFQYSWFYLSL